jgi:hypothetical protein
MSHSRFAEATRSGRSPCPPPEYGLAMTTRLLRTGSPNSGPRYVSSIRCHHSLSGVTGQASQAASILDHTPCVTIDTTSCRRRMQSRGLSVASPTHFSNRPCSSRTQGGTGQPRLTRAGEARAAAAASGPESHQSAERQCSPRRVRPCGTVATLRFTNPPVIVRMREGLERRTRTDGRHASRRVLAGKPSP